MQKRTMTQGQLNRAVYIAGGDIDATPVYRAPDLGEPPRQVCLTAETECLVGGGCTKIVYLADVYAAVEVPEPHLRLADRGHKALHTNWELWCMLPEPLPGAHIGGLFIGQLAELPIGGVMMRFKISAGPPALIG